MYSFNYYFTIEISTAGFYVFHFSFYYFPTEFEKQRLGSIRPLQELVQETSMTEDDWMHYCSTRFGLTVSQCAYITY